MRTLMTIGSSLLLCTAALGEDGRTLAQVEQDVLASFNFDGGDVDDIGHKSADFGRPKGPEDNEDDGELTLRGGPVNDACSAATQIPLGTIVYNPPQISTVGATIEFCEAAESCESGSAGVSNTVWYRYTAAADGRIEANTFGSSYNTVLSVFDGCGTGFLPPCTTVPTELACNDNAGFGTASQLSLDVVAGESYLIKVSDYNSAAGGGLLDFNLLYYPPNDNCVDATEIPGVVAYDPPLLATHNAQTDLCEAPESCEFNGVGVSNSVWYAFVAPCDGSLSVNTNGSSYDTVLSIHDGCGEFVAIDAPCNLPSEIACDDDAGTGTNSQLVDVPVVGGQRYLIKVADYNTTQGGGFLDFNLLFSGGLAPTVDISSPSTSSCICDLATITGTASANGDPVSWTLEARSVNGGSWSEISSGQNDVNASTLGLWNTSALPEGNYLLRLTAENGCGVSDTAVELVHVSQQFDKAEIQNPGGGAILGGRVCLDGSAYDNHCFDSYELNWRPSGGGSFLPVDPAQPLYTTGVINNPLGQWDTDAAGVADGDYDIELIGYTTCGDTAFDVLTITVDNTAPRAGLDNPANCELVDGVLEIFGTASDANLAGWTLQVTGGPYSGWTTLASGTSNVNNGLLATWDTSTLPPCAYTLRLTVSDKSAQNCNGAIVNQSEALASVIVDAPACPGDVDGDGDVDLADLATVLSFFGEQCF